MYADPLQTCRQMGWAERDPYKYYPERGMYLHELYPSLLCGSQPMSREDIRKLADFLGSRGSILSLQQDKDLAHWGVDLQDLQSEAQERDLNYLRRPVHLLFPIINVKVQFLARLAMRSSSRIKKLVLSVQDGFSALLHMSMSKPWLQC